MHFDGNGGAGFKDRFAVFIEHRAHTAESRPSQQHVALFQGARLNKNRRNRATAFVEARFNDNTFCRRILDGFQLKNLSLQQNCLQQFVKTQPGFRRYLHKHHIAAIFFRQNILGDQLLPDAIRIGVGLIHFIDRNNDGYICRPGMCDGFLRLRHDAVVCGNNKNHQVGDL